MGELSELICLLPFSVEVFLRSAPLRRLWNQKRMFVDSLIICR